MATIFESKPGTAILLTVDDGDSGLPLTIDGLAGSWFPGFKSILTELSVSLDGNYQFLHTLKSVIYIYTFGDRISQLRISGLAFQQTCNGDRVTGIEKILNYYEKNRVAARSSPIQIAIGFTPPGQFRGYLTHFKCDIIKPEQRIGYFSFIFHVIPGGT